MAGPLHAFRKHQKKLLAVFGIGIIFVFVVGSSITQFFQQQGPRGTRSREVVATWKHGRKTEEISIAKLQQMSQQERLAQEFLTKVAEETSKKQGVSKVASLRVQSMPSRSEIELIDKVAKAARAEEMGFLVDDQVIKDYLFQFCDGKLGDADLARIVKNITRQDGSDRELFDWLRIEMLAKVVDDLLRNDVGSQTPADVWQQYNKLSRRVVLEVMPLEVASFVDKIGSQPSESQIASLYDKYKERFGFPDDPEPGFRQLPKLQFRYVALDREKFIDAEAAKVTREQIEKFYEENKDNLFVKPTTGGQFQDDSSKKDPPKDDQKPKSDPPQDKDPKEDQPADKADKEKGDNKDNTPKKENDNNQKPQPKGDEKKDAPVEKKTETDPKKEADPDQSSDRAKSAGQGEFLVSLAADEPADEKDRPKKSDEKKQDPPTKTPPANDKAAEEKKEPGKDDSKKKDDKKETGGEKSQPDDKKPGDKKDGDEKTPPPPKKEYIPLKEKEEEIRRDHLAADPAMAQMGVAREHLTNAMKAYALKFTSWYDNQQRPEEQRDKSIEKPEPFTFADILADQRKKVVDYEKRFKLPTDEEALNKLDEEYRRTRQREKAKEVARMLRAVRALKALELVIDGEPLPLLDMLEMDKKDDNDKHVHQLAAGSFGGFVSFTQLTYQREMPFYTPASIDYKFDDDKQLKAGQFVFWKTDFQADKVPELDDVRDQVVKAWQNQQARDLAKKEAEQQVEAARKSGKTLKETFASSAEKVFETIPFSWVSVGNTPFGTSRSPTVTLSTVPNLDKIDDDFMKGVFALRKGGVDFAFNRPRTHVYVYRLVNELSDRDERLAGFLGDPHRMMQMGGPISQLSNMEQNRISGQILDHFRKEMEIKVGQAEGQ